jgi:drug/metabolite transporter (DMT)-like permease
VNILPTPPPPAPTPTAPLTAPPAATSPDLFTPTNIALIALSVAALVVGQVLLKLAMRRTSDPSPSQAAQPPPARTGPRPAFLALGIACMTVWFMTWLHLLGVFPLSLLFPFEGLASVLLSLAAACILRERTSLRLWCGVALVGLGVALVGWA